METPKSRRMCGIKEQRTKGERDITNLTNFTSDYDMELIKASGKVVRMRKRTRTVLELTQTRWKLNYWRATKVIHLAQNI